MDLGGALNFPRSHEVLAIELLDNYTVGVTVLAECNVLTVIIDI